MAGSAVARAAAPGAPGEMPAPAVRTPGQPRNRPLPYRPDSRRAVPSGCSIRHRPSTAERTWKPPRARRMISRASGATTRAPAARAASSSAATATRAILPDASVHPCPTAAPGALTGRLRPAPGTIWRTPVPRILPSTGTPRAKSGLSAVPVSGETGEGSDAFRQEAVTCGPERSWRIRLARRFWYPIEVRISA